MYSTKGLKLINGVVVANTKQFGWRSIIGFRVQILVYEKDKPRFYEGRIQNISGDKVQIKVPVFQPGKADKNFVVSFKDSWEILGPPIVKPVVPEPPRQPLVGPRCEEFRDAIHPRTCQKLVLQCVLREGHNGAHHYENPSNKARK